MNTPSPLIPEGSNLEQKFHSRSRLKIAVFAVIGAHVVLLTGLLVQGCKREQPLPPPETTDTSYSPDDTSMAPLTSSVPSYVEQPVVTPTGTPTTLPQTGVGQPIPGSGQPSQTYVPSIPDTMAPPPAATEYVIVKGDTYSSLSTRFGVSVKAITDANPGVDPAKLQIGKKLVIPAPAPAATPAVNGSSSATSATGETIYTVKSGDTLIKIADNYHTTYKAIKAANNLTTDRIVVGQKLKIPASSAQ